MDRSSVVFPQPLGPSSAVMDPPVTARSTDRNTGSCPKRFETARTATPTPTPPFRSLMTTARLPGRAPTRGKRPSKC